MKGEDAIHVVAVTKVFVRTLGPEVRTVLVKTVTAVGLLIEVIKHDHEPLGGCVERLERIRLKELLERIERSVLRKHQTLIASLTKRFQTGRNVALELRPLPIKLIEEFFQIQVIKRIPDGTSTRVSNVTTILSRNGLGVLREAFGEFFHV